jgi:dTDP-4-amino-4,6-dideoxygalactose transaminase
LPSGPGQRLPLITATPGSEVDSVPLFDVARSFAGVRAEAIAAFARLMSCGQFVLGPDLADFEGRFAAYCGVEHCVGVSDGTSALQLALQALGVERGASVVTVPNTFVGTVEAIAAAHARPRLVDVDATTRCMDVARLESAVDDETAAVIPVHLYGRLAPMVEITELCARGAVPVVEDAAQAHGASRGGLRAGAWGDAAAFSFYPTKNLGAAGDGGALVSRSADVAEAARSLRHHGCAPGDPNRHERVGRTARLDNVQAALLSLRLDHLDAHNDERRQAVELYRELLRDAPVVMPAVDSPGERQVYHLFVVEVPERARVLAALRDQGIGAGVHYPTPIHLQPAWRSLGYARGDFPVAEHLAEHCLSLPIFPGITEAEQVRVADALTRALA